MIYPEFIGLHDTIGVTALSTGVLDKIESYERSCNQLREQGFSVVETENVRTSGVVSGSGEERAKQLMELFENKDVKAIISASGGDFLTEMLPYVKFDKMKKTPKWIQGYSDNTGILFPYTVNYDVATLYGPNAGGFDMNPMHESLLTNIKYLQGCMEEQHSFEKYQNGFMDDSKGYLLSEPVNWETPHGVVNETGRMIGGCLDVLAYLVGTKYANVENFLEKYKNDGFIWYFDIFALKAEEVSHVLWHMKEAGWFQYAKAFMIGRVCFPGSMLDMNYVDAFERILPKDVPLIFGADVGHVKPVMTIMNGAMGQVQAKDGKGSLKQWIF